MRGVLTILKAVCENECSSYSLLVLRDDENQPGCIFDVIDLRAGSWHDNKVPCTSSLESLCRV